MEYLERHERQLRWVTRHLAEGEEPVVDRASGRGQLVERLATDTSRPLVATDSSPRVLRRHRRWLQAGLDVLLHRQGALQESSDAG